MTVKNIKGGDNVVEKKFAIGVSGAVGCLVLPNGYSYEMKRRDGEGPVAAEIH